VKTKTGLDLAGATDPGCVRANNEDNFVVDDELGLLLVADGMGGHNSGEVASGIAAETVLEYARRMIGGPKQLVPEGGEPTSSVRARQLEHFVKAANTMIYEKGRAFPKDAGMGTTVVAALADSRMLTVAHVGDSRAYLFRRGHLQQLTEDHSLVGDQVRRGLISPDEAAHSNLQNILTRALGAEKDVIVDVADHPLMPGDVVLLVSDGLTKMLDDAAVTRTIAQSRSAETIVATLISQAREAGGVDNVTVVAALVPEPGRSGLGGLGGLVARWLGK
jgi:PPM family protein phosphatase